MNHRMLRFPSQWDWHVLHLQRPLSEGMSRRSKHASTASRAEVDKRSEYSFLAKDSPSQARQLTPDSASEFRESFRHELKDELPELGNWLEEAERCNHNHIAVSELNGGVPVLHGTLLFQVSEDSEDITPLHFWITAKKLVTVHHDLRLSVRLAMDPWKDKLDRCESAPEAFFVIIGCVLETFHAGLDGFETRLGELERSMRTRNRTGIMNNIFERRYDLLHWSHLFIPIREIHGAAKEAFLDMLVEQEEFKRIEYKLDRIGVLLTHYAMEIDTLLAMDDAISSFRGNDIMKTLTIFTALFSPATVVGALWGMNFEKIPWATEPYGFIVTTAVVVISTVLIYWWLWQKGWTGDLLNGQRPNTKLRTDKRRSRSRRPGPPSDPAEDEKGNVHVG
ncbi:Mg2+ and Co2+ transporter CorA [Paenibacillus phyllosphaerae]|uniref:Mg2+ and Co2+ transporter CorA n=1 Tax=Paenibacillus phyllosphaerae TaxID=274593 RepID=A0A7W5FPB8_9BACL|nr:magnesium transporter CorA family protein [Paenibacillus phyllosphaerae]MBB3112062.1 Mg2+ and Co2+ transporter CorA [Paenibacillus phyllosphaerae]